MPLNPSKRFSGGQILHDTDLAAVNALLNDLAGRDGVIDLDDGLRVPWRTPYHNELRFRLPKATQADYDAVYTEPVVNQQSDAHRNRPASPWVGRLLFDVDKTVPAAQRLAHQTTDLEHQVRLVAYLTDPPEWTRRPVQGYWLILPSVDIAGGNYEGLNLVTFEHLDFNGGVYRTGDEGDGADKVSVGNHTHPYTPPSE